MAHRRACWTEPRRAGVDRSVTGLHLVRIAVDPHALIAFAITEGVDDDDGGYAAHLALRRRFGTAAPQPFRLVPEGEPHVLGYTADAAALMDAAGLPTLDDRLGAVFPASPQTKPMPAAWRSGARFDFTVRVRPVRRYGPRARQARVADGKHPASERDAFLVAVEAAAGDTVDRAAVYSEWLEQQVARTVDIHDLTIAAMRRLSTRRSTHGQPGPARIEGYEVTFAGTLGVRDPNAFTALLRRGVGRHAAFGFGMMALAPPRTG